MYTFGGLDEYANLMATRIKGFIDKNYRTAAEPENTTIIGSSHGGLASFYIANAYPEQFGRAVAMSPSFWVGLDSTLGFKPIENSKLVEVRHCR
jgi:predicted alpha/beta superfamily hydrolase